MVTQTPQLDRGMIQSELDYMKGEDDIAKAQQAYLTNLANRDKLLAEREAGIEDQRTRDQYGNLVETFATGETSQLLPKSAIDALRQEDKKSIGTGTGGMLSFADDIKLSRKAMEFIRNLAVYENEYGQEQGRKYVSKEFAKLSEKEQAEVVEYLESQQ